MTTIIVRTHKEDEVNQRIDKQFLIGVQAVVDHYVEIFETYGAVKVPPDVESSYSFSEGVSYARDAIRAALDELVRSAETRNDVKFAFQFEPERLADGANIASDIVRPFGDSDRGAEIETIQTDDAVFVLFRFVVGVTPKGMVDFVSPIFNRLLADAKPTGYQVSGAITVKDIIFERVEPKPDAGTEGDAEPEPDAGTESGAE